MDQVLKVKRQPCPRENANIFSILTFSYTLHTFIKGFLKKTLDEKDIPAVSKNSKASKLGDKLEKYWNKQIAKTKPSLWIAIIQSFGLECVVIGFALCFNQIVLRLLRTLSLIEILQYFSQDSNLDLKDVYTYSGFIVALTLLNVFVSQLSKLYIQLLGMKIKVACSSLIYRKSLKLSKNVLEDVGIGHIDNLLANDLSRLDTSIFCINYFWISPIEIIVLTTVLCVQLGLTSTIGVAFLVLVCPVLIGMAKYFSSIRLKTATKTDERIQLMSEIINGIKVIKMYTWEKPFAKLIDSVRRSEVLKIRNSNYIRGVLRLSLIMPKIALFLTIIAYVLSGNKLTAAFVFTVASYLENIRISLIANVVLSMSVVAELHVSIKRIQKLLLLEEIKQANNEHNQKPGIFLEDVRARWNKNVPKLTLNNITLVIEEKQLVGIVGPVGSGKSSIFQVILNELEIESGSVKVYGKISYASQEPWVFSGNIQQNVLFGQPLNLQRYRDVLKVCALEQDLLHLPYGDQTLTGERGVILSGGQKSRVSLARAIYMDADMYLLDDPFSAVDIHVANHIFQQCITKFLGEKTVVLITHQVQFLSNFKRVYLLENGSFSTSGTYEELKLCASTFSKHLNKYVPTALEIVCENNDTLLEVYKNKEAPENFKELRNIGTASNDAYITFVKAGDSMIKLFGVIAAFIVSHTLISASDLFITYWVNMQQNESDNSNDLSDVSYVYIYTGLALSSVIVLLFRLYVHFNFLTKISINLHNKMFVNVVNTKMKFFHINYSGRILNRFSKDVGMIDEIIPVAIMDLLHTILGSLGYVILICVTNPWLAIATVIMSVFSYLVRHVYITTSQSLRRLEGAARSPVYGHVSESLQGLATIRAYNAEPILQHEFDNHQDFHSSIQSVFLACTRTFGFYIDLLCFVYITIVTFSIVLNENEQYAGTVGLGITQAISLIGSLQWGLLQSTEMEGYVTSIERVVEYVNLPAEDENTEPDTPSEWPKNGNIRFLSLSLRYSDDQHNVLKNISINIKAREKIGIVGRTGAGKTSLITALFQLANTDGAILIDDIDITKIPLQSLRSKISIISQDPVLFSGTVKRNLDPFNLYTDLDLWSALEEVQLKPTISSLPSGLDYIVTEGGLNFSVGERQLICLARALIRKNRILVLDEATANVDLYSDALIQETVRNKFVGCTVLTIAHRLNTIIDSDKVLVLDAGEVVQYDHPHLLLQNQKGMFYKMVQKTGNRMASTLIKTAEESYKYREKLLHN